VKFKPRKIIAVDIDSTLLTKGKLNQDLVSWVAEKRKDGFDVMLWSAQGRKYAETVADNHGITDLFTHIIGKPSYIVDDVGWKWTRYTRVFFKNFRKL